MSPHSPSLNDGPNFENVLSTGSGWLFQTVLQVVSAAKITGIQWSNAHTSCQLSAASIFALVITIHPSLSSDPFEPFRCGCLQYTRFC